MGNTQKKYQTIASSTWVLFRVILTINVMCLSISSHAQTLPDYYQAHTNQCGNNYANQKPPQLLGNKKLEIYYLCFNGFAVGYSSLSKTALWSAEHLTRTRIEQTNNLTRVDNFHEESQLPDRIKAYLKDYQKVPYDRGHLAPNADMNTTEAQYDSFSLANIVPQNPKNNRGIWRGIEARTRYMAMKYQSIYVVTGVAFLNTHVKKINNNVLVPSHLYKAIYIPSQKQAGVYFVPNDDSQRVEIISLNELATRTGIDTMPGLTGDIQNTAMPLPTDNNEPKQQTRKQSPQNEDILLVLVNLLLTIFKWLATLFKN